MVVSGNKLTIIALAYVGAMAQTGGDAQLLFAGGAPVCRYIIFPSFFQFLTAVTNLPTKSDSLLPQFGLVSFLLIAKSRRAAIDVPVSRFPWLRSFYINNVTILKNIYCRSFGHLVQLC